MMVATRRSRVFAVAAVVCVLCLAVLTHADRSADAVSALRQRSRGRQQLMRSTVTVEPVGAGIAGAGLLSNVGEKITSAVTSYKTRSHQESLAGKIKASKDMWCEILLIQAEAEAQRFAQAALIIKDIHPKLSATGKVADPAALALTQRELLKFAVRIEISQQWTQSQLLPANACPSLKPSDTDGITGGATVTPMTKNVKAKADLDITGGATVKPWGKVDGVTGEAEVRAISLTKVRSLYTDAQDTVTLKLAELSLLLKGGPSSAPSAGAAAAKAKEKKSVEDERNSIAAKITKQAADTLAKLGVDAAKDFAQDMAVGTFQAVGGATADAVVGAAVPVVGVASTGSSLFSIGSAISGYYTEWARDEENAKEILNDAHYAACNMVLALFRDSCRFIVSDALFNQLRTSAKAKAEIDALLQAWRSNPLGVLSAYEALGCKALQKTSDVFMNDWKNKVKTVVDKHPGPSPAMTQQITDLFPAFEAMFKSAHKTTQDVIALKDVEAIKHEAYKGSQRKLQVLAPNGQFIPISQEQATALEKVPVPVVEKAALLTPLDEPVTGVELIEHHSAQAPTITNYLFMDDRRPGKALKDTDDTIQRLKALKEKGYHGQVIPLSKWTNGHEQTTIELHVRKSKAGIPVRQIFIIHNEKGQKAGKMTPAQDEFLNAKDKARLVIRSHVDMTSANKKKDTDGFWSRTVDYFKTHDNFYFCAEKDPTLYWDGTLNTLVTASRHKVFDN